MIDTLAGCDWDHVGRAETGVTHRSTTSSRLPGKAIEGAVHFRVAQLVDCDDCGGQRLVLPGSEPGPHSPHWREGRMVDCLGRELAPATRTNGNKHA